jgi:hypothetical protein
VLVVLTPRLVRWPPFERARSSLLLAENGAKSQRSFSLLKSTQKNESVVHEILEPLLFWLSLKPAMSEVDGGASAMLGHAGNRFPKGTQQAARKRR